MRRTKTYAPRGARALVRQVRTLVGFCNRETIPPFPSKRAKSINGGLRRGAPFFGQRTLGFFQSLIFPLGRTRQTPAQLFPCLRQLLVSSAIALLSNSCRRRSIRRLRRGSTRGVPTRRQIGITSLGMPRTQLPYSQQRPSGDHSRGNAFPDSQDTPPRSPRHPLVPDPV